MKNNKKLFTAMLLSSVIAGSAHATAVIGNATDTFNWSGTVPAKPVTNGIVIASSTGSNLDAGKLQFDREGNLVGSSAIGFKVKKMSGADGNTPEEFTADELIDTKLSYKVLSFKSAGTLSGPNTSLAVASQYFTLKSGPDLLDLSKIYPMDTNFVNLTVDKNSSASAATNQPIQGEVVTVEAVIMVEATTF